MNNKKLKILHIASGDSWAGAEVQTYNMVSQLSGNSNIDIKIILLNHGVLENKLRDKGVNVYVIDENKHIFLAILYRIFIFIFKDRPNIIHSHRIKENTLAGIISFFYKDILCISTVHGDAEIKYRYRDFYKRFYLIVERYFLYYYFDRIVYVSEELKDKLKLKYGSKKALVIENGINVDEVHKMSCEPVLVKLSDNKIRIAFLGRLVSVKRLDMFINIAELLVKNNNDKFIFYIIGEGPKYKTINQEISEKGLVNSVKMLGFISNPLPILKEMDYLLITSDHEGLPTNLLEAMFLEVPVISNNLGGINKVLDNGSFGKLVDIQDAEAYLKVINYCLINSEEVKSIARRAKSRVSESYSAIRNAKLYADAYCQMSMSRKKQTLLK